MWSSPPHRSSNSPIEVSPSWELTDSEISTCRFQHLKNYRNPAVVRPHHHTILRIQIAYTFWQIESTSNAIKHSLPCKLIWSDPRLPNRVAAALPGELSCPISLLSTIYIRRTRSFENHGVLYNYYAVYGVVEVRRNTPRWCNVSTRLESCICDHTPNWRMYDLKQTRSGFTNLPKKYMHVSSD